MTGVGLGQHAARDELSTPAGEHQVEFSQCLEYRNRSDDAS
jgi:hypothetical protein